MVANKTDIHWNIESFSLKIIKPQTTVTSGIMKYPKLASVVWFVWIAKMKKNQLIAIRTEAKSIIGNWPLELKIADQSSFTRP